MGLDLYLDNSADAGEDDHLHNSNITHNLGEMAEEAGIYQALWRPEELRVKYAKELITPIEKGLADLKARPDHYKQFDDPGGWGRYIHFVPFVEEYLNALKEFPDALVTASR